MTATPFCILPMTSINYIEITTGMGDITRKLLNKWSENVGVDIENQIKDFNNEFQLSPNAPTPYNFGKK
jgi:hypothetical protein